MRPLKRPTRQDPWTDAKNRSRKRRGRLFLGLTFFAAVVLSIPALVVYIGYLHFAQDLPSLDALRNYRPSVITYFYSDDGRGIGEFFRERRIVTPLTRIPRRVIMAFIAAEDANFFNHPGIDLQGVVRALIRNMEAGRIVQGASTITQQVTRTFLLSNERTYARKIREAILAYRLEQNLTKKEILYLYLNQIYLGHGAYGVEAAAQGFFGKSVERLSLGQAALIAGLVKAPNRYSPFRHPLAAKSRQGYVLRRMAESGFITPAQARQAAEERLDYKERPEVNLERAPYFTEHVRRFVESMAGSERLLTDGLRVYTTVNLETQAAARRAIRRGLEELAGRQPKSGREAETSPVQAALVCLDAGTGAVKAMVGGRDFIESSFNRAAQSRRQPGSAFKPFVYVAAMDSGFTPADIIIDEPIEYDDNGKVWSPKNYDRKFNGPTTLYTGLVKSRNVVAVRLLEKVGLGRVIRCAHRMGVKSPLGPNLSLALGTSEVSLLEMTSAFTTFPNQGVRAAPMFITRIEDRDGKVIARFRPRRIKALKPETAYVVLEMLRGVVKHGTGGAAAALGRPVAGKTGTTSNLADAWFIGFTPGLAAGVWVGRDRCERLGPRETGGRAAAPIFLDFMQEVLHDRPAREFPLPAGVTFAAIDPKTGEFAGQDTEEPLLVCFKQDQIGKSSLSEETAEAEDGSVVEHVRLTFRGKQRYSSRVRRSGPIRTRPGNKGRAAFTVSSKKPGSKTAKPPQVSE